MVTFFSGKTGGHIKRLSISTTMSLWLLMNAMKLMKIGICSIKIGMSKGIITFKLCEFSLNAESNQKSSTQL